jgi:hypothetical protein
MSSLEMGERMSRGVFTFVLSFMFLNTFYSFTSCFADTNVSGKQEGTWTLASSPYILTGDITIEEGKLLTIESGVEVQTPVSTRDFFIQGTLTGNNVNFTVSSTELQVHSTGILNLTDCNVGGFIHFYEGSGGSVSGGKVSYINLQGTGIRNIKNISSINYMNLYDEGGADLQVSGNTFMGDNPFRVHTPTFDACGITGNTYSGADPTILMRGRVSRDHVLSGIECLKKYQLITGDDLTIDSGYTLTIDPNVEIYTFVSTSEVIIGGMLTADNAILSGTWTNLQVQSTGWINLTNSDIAGVIHFYDGAGGTVSNCSIGHISLEGTGSRTITNNSSIGYMILDGPGGIGLQVTGNTFTSEVPFRLKNLLFDVSVITGNTITNPAPYISFHGTVNEDLQMSGIDGVDTYQINILKNFIINPEATVTVAPGVEIRTDSTSDIEIYGTLKAESATFSGTSTDLVVHGLGNLDVSSCYIDGQILLENDSNGWINECYTGSIAIEDPNTCKIFCNDIAYINLNGRTTGCIQNNIIRTEYPFRLNHPDIDTHNICGNTFNHPEPLLGIRGIFEYDTLLGYIDGLGNYEQTGHLTVDSNTVVITARGISIDCSSSSYTINVNGSFLAEEISITGTWSEITVNTDASVEFYNCIMPKTLNINEDSNAVLSYCQLKTLNINSLSANDLVMNNFSNALVRAEGNMSDTIQLENNWWGTTDPLLIADKIIDNSDDPARPTVNFEPVLTEEPIALPVIPGDFIGNYNVEMDDLEYFCNYWLETCCKTGDWCGGTDLNRDGDVNFFDFAVFAYNWIINDY